MKLTFLGAAHEVTGSRFLLEACGKYIMVDYGMEQGMDVYQNADLPIMESQIDYVLLTHAHIDHSGYLPLLYKNGFRGKIFATETTADLCKIMLLDSAHIQESDAEYKNRKAQRSGKALVEPLYTQEHALATCQLFSPCKYRQQVDICEGISIRMEDVGHLMGSASIEVQVTEGNDVQTIVFSGDIGNLNQPLLRDPQYMTKADYVVMESTYGDRTHGPVPDYIGELTKILQETLDRGGNLVIPSFAVGRTQEMLYFFRHIKEHKLINGHDDFPVYIDSPMAIEATKVFNENTMECADEDTVALIKRGINPITFDGLHVAVTSDESKQINVDPTPKVIISASGMCDAGRIRHHLKHNLWRPESTILFVGYQSNGTLGRSLIEGVDKVKLFGETIQVKAHVTALAGVSGHADQNGLQTWIGHFDPKPKHVFVVHGDDDVVGVFEGLLKKEFGLSASSPYNGESWELPAMKMLCEGNKQKLVKADKAVAASDAVPEKKESVPQVAAKQEKKPAKKENLSAAYANLLVAGEKLAELLERMKNYTKKEQQKMTNGIYALMRKYERRRRK